MTYISCLCKIQHIIVRLFYTHVIFIDHKRHIRLMIQSVAVSIHLMTCMNIKLSGCLCHPQRTCLKRNIRIRSVYGNRPYSLKIFGIFYDSHYFFFIAVIWISLSEHEIIMIASTVKSAKQTQLHCNRFTSGLLACRRIVFNDHFSAAMLHSRKCSVCIRNQIRINCLTPYCIIIQRMIIRSITICNRRCFIRVLNRRFSRHRHRTLRRQTACCTDCDHCLSFAPAEYLSRPVDARDFRIAALPTVDFFHCSVCHRCKLQCIAYIYRMAASFHFQAGRFLPWEKFIIIIIAGFFNRCNPAFVFHQTEYRIICFCRIKLFSALDVIFRYV